MIAATRSELVRLLRPRLLIGWFGLTALFAALINTVMFSLTGGDAPPAGPGVVFPDAATLQSADGLVAGLSAAASMFGVVSLSLWALVTATDYSSGLIRLLVAAQPRRSTLLVGKVVALVLGTAVATTVALVVNVGVAPVAADAAGLDSSLWRDDVTVALLLDAWLSAFAAAVVWGVIGLALAVVLRSSALAISLGVGWVLVVESVVAAAFDGGTDWLPGTALTALAAGGNDVLDHAQAGALALAYAGVGLAAALVVGWRRDVTD